MKTNPEKISDEITKNIQSIRQTIQNTAENSGKNPTDIKLLAVSKTRTATDIQLAYHAGQIDFGENYLKEALDKIKALQDLPIIWHFIGQIQSNKTRHIAENFSWIHTLSSLKHAQRINEQRPSSLPPVNVCIQVNIDEEETKGGLFVNDVETLAHQIQGLPNLKLRGLMAIPKVSKIANTQRQAFHKLSSLMSTLNKQGYNLDTLSMGMSGDFTVAIEEGSTIVRIGTAIFGKRE